MNHLALKICIAVLAFALGLTVAGLWSRLMWLNTPEQSSATYNINGRVSEIGLEHSCYLRCLSDRVVLRSDGTAERMTDDYPDKVLYRGRVKAEDFFRLAEMLEAREFFSLDEKYFPVTTHSSDVMINAVRDGERKTVWREMSMRNAQTEEIEATIEEIVRRVEWIRAEK